MYHLLLSTNRNSSIIAPIKEVSPVRKFVNGFLIVNCKSISELNFMCIDYLQLMIIFQHLHLYEIRTNCSLIPYYMYMYIMYIYIYTLYGIQDPGPCIHVTVCIYRSVSCTTRNYKHCLPLVVIIAT